MTDISPAMRSAILGNTYITSRLSTWQGSPAVLTRLPVPEGVTFPCIVIPFNSVTSNQDALVNKRTVIIRDIMVYGNIAAAGTPEDQTRRVDEMAFELRRLFHRNKRALVNTSYHVIDIVANGPIPAPVDDNETTGRMVTLTVRIEDGS
jgi:hypothetical protein